MIMGFPGSTSCYLTVSEVKERMESENDPRIRIRGARLAVLKEVMNASDKIRIQYANKYAGSSNYWKNSIGMNKAIIDNDVLGTKAAQEATLLAEEATRKAERAKAEGSDGDRAVIDKSVDGKNAICSPINVKFLSVVGGTATPAPRGGCSARPSRASLARAWSAGRLFFRMRIALPAPPCVW